MSYIANQERYFQIGQGLVSGQTHIHKFGRNPTIDGAFEDIWNGGASYTGHDATAAETVEVYSSSANDASGGTGAITVQVYGLDSNYADQNETVTLNGTTAVDTVNTYIRLNRMIVRTAGSTGSNEGTLTARQKTTTANVFAVMPIGYNQTMIAAYTIPAAKTAYLTGWFASASKKQAFFSQVRLRMRPLNEVFQVKEEFTIASTGSSYAQREYAVPKGKIAAKTDIVITADSSVTDSGISAGFDLILVDD